MMSPEEEEEMEGLYSIDGVRIILLQGSALIMLFWILCNTTFRDTSIICWDKSFLDILRKCY